MLANRTIASGVAGRSALIDYDYDHAYIDEMFDLLAFG